MSSNRIFKLDSPPLKGEDVREFQRVLTSRYMAWDINTSVDDDGDYGVRTRDAAKQVCVGLGILHVTAMKHGVTPELRDKMKDPSLRTDREKERAQNAAAKEFRAKLRARFKTSIGGSVGTLTGIDVSNNQSAVDFAKVKSQGHRFAFHKVSEGLGTPDRKFGPRWKAMREAGLVRGAYHFARPQRGRDPKAEVREFLGLIAQAGGLKDGDLRPVLDIEAFGAAGNLSAAQTQAWVRGFVDEVRARAGVRPIIYTGAFWRDAMGNPRENFDCPLWLAAYVTDPKRFIPRAWEAESFSIWQHTDKGRCPGVPGDVDLNRLPGGDAAINRLLI